MRHALKRVAIVAATALVFAVGAAPAFAGAPSAPLGVSASPASDQALVSWTAPGDGGSPITG
ncbi:MAG: hypothetical protein ACLP50_17215, partial [Solirubrobacteraceae bacterium]